ncbi:MAG: TonB family protein, partial [Myxococcota bacterium]
MNARAVIVAGVLLLTCSLAHADNEQPGMREREEEPRAAPRLTKAPKLLKRVDPEYPDGARKEGRAGVVVLRLTIEADGHVSTADVLSSAGADLDQAAQAAALQLLFEPAEVDDVPTAIQVDYRQVFVLQKAPPPAELPPPVPTTADAGLPDLEVPDAGPTVPPAPPTPPVLFRGIVRESGTKHALPEAEIAVELDDGTHLLANTSADGRFFLQDVPAGTHTVHISATNHERYQTVEEFQVNQLVEAVYYLPRSSYNKFETVVRDRRPSKEVNRISLSRGEVSEVPGTFGDPLRVIENLPGLARAPALGGQLLVRGASPASTAVYIDGVQIPQLYHFGGLTSVVNANFLEDIEFQPGGFGSRYGRATAGVVDVKSRKLAFDGFKGAASVDLMQTSVFLGVPVTFWGEPVDSNQPDPRRVTFGFAARRSYIDTIIPVALDLFLPSGTGALTLAPVYQDYQLKAEYWPLAAHKFSVMAFGSEDSLKLLVGGNADGSGVGITSATRFHRLVGTWDWRIAPRLRNHVQLYGGVDEQTTGMGGGALSLNSDGVTAIFGARSDLRYELTSFLSISGGVDYLLRSNSTTSSLPGGGGGLMVGLG